MRGFPSSQLSDIEYQNGPSEAIELGGPRYEDYEVEPDPIAPFMARNIMANRRRRNFYVEDGGAIIYFDPDAPTVPSAKPKRVYGRDR